MSITIAGKLTVIERNGRNGVFSVGELTTEIGTFKLKNRALEQFPEGSYDGVFYITKIYNQSNFAKGQIWVSLYADLDWDALQILAQNHQLNDVSASLEISAITEAEQSAEQHSAESSTTVVSQANASETHSEAHNPATTTAALFEEDGLVDSMEKLNPLLQANAPSIKLDASLDDRNLFRQLREAIKENGYRFHAQTQSWVKP